MHIKRKIITVFSLLIIGASAAICCSNVMIKGKGGVIVGRNMDESMSYDSWVGYGLKNTKNTSNINLQKCANPKKWTNLYAYAGLNGFFKSQKMCDGINSQGLYFGVQALNQIAVFPDYNKKNSKPALGVLDIGSFVLGTSKNVSEAIEKLRKCQLVLNAYQIGSGKKAKYLMGGMHFILRDAYGDSAIIELVKGDNGYKYFINIYYQEAGSESIILNSYVNDKNSAVITKSIISSPNFNVVTNSPGYEWQLNNTIDTINVIDKEFTSNNIDYKIPKIDGYIQNGSGLLGLPGDFTSPSRFTRGYYLAKLMPPTYTIKQTEFAVYEVIQSMAQPISGSLCPTLWTSMSNLNAKTYSWFVRCRIAPPYKSWKGLILFTNLQKDKQWRTIKVSDDLTKESLRRQLPPLTKYILHEIKVKKCLIIASKAQVERVKKMLADGPTAADKNNSKFINL